MYDVIKVTLDYMDSVDGIIPMAYAIGLSKKARSNSTKWHKGEHVEVCTSTRKQTNGIVYSWAAHSSQSWTITAMI